MQAYWLTLLRMFISGAMALPSHGQMHSDEPVLEWVYIGNNYETLVSHII